MTIIWTRLFVRVFEPDINQEQRNQGTGELEAIYGNWCESSTEDEAVEVRKVIQKECSFLGQYLGPV